MKNSNRLNKQVTRSALATAAMLFCLSPAQAEITFVFNYNDVNVGFNDPMLGQARRESLEQTGQLLSALFPGLNASITMDVDGANTEDSTLAAASSNPPANCTPGLGNRGVVGVKALGGSDINGATADGSVTVNFEDVLWDLDDDISSDRFDFKSTMLHELLHAMGFSNDLAAEDGSDPCGQAPPSPGGFNPYDDFLGDLNKDFIDPQGVVDLPLWQRARVGGAGNNGILWRGQNGQAGNNGASIPLFSPSEFSFGSSVAHLDDEFFTNVALLMEAATVPGTGTRTLSSQEEGMLRDMGFSSVGGGDGGGGGGGGGGTGAGDSNRIVTPTLPVDPALACPGFYVAEIRGVNSDGRFGLKIDLDPNGNKLLQGGINLGGRFDVAGKPGFAAFNIANPAGEPQNINLQLQVSKPAGMSYEYKLTRRFGDGSSQFILGETETSDMVNLSQVVDPGFYVFELISVGDGAASAGFAVSLGTSFTDRPGGAFDGGVNLGGVVEGDSVGFASFCISEAQPVRLETLGDGSYPGAFPGGSANLSLLVKNGQSGEVIVQVP